MMHTPTTPRRWFRFTVRTILIVTAFCAIGLAWFADRTKIKREHAAELEKLKASHEYEVTVDGTPGIQLEMTLVTKPATIRREIVTVPFSAKFEAVQAAVWFDTLPDGKSGGPGATYTIKLKRDGVTGAECNGTGRNQSQWRLNDF
jgi:hypothetical protein